MFRKLSEAPVVFFINKSSLYFNVAARQEEIADYWLRHIAIF